MSEVELLELMLKATQVKKLQWQQIPGTDRYEAEVDRYLYIIEYQSPSLPNGGSCDGSLIRVVIAGVLITFAEGTPQEGIVEKILATAFPDWADHIYIVEENRREAAERLSALIDR